MFLLKTSILSLCVRDKLQVRITLPSQNKFCERFERGRDDGLRCFVEVDGRSRLMQFHAGARVDGMVTRREEFGLLVRFGF